MNLPTSCCVRICQGKACRKAGSAQVLQQFLAHPIAGIPIEPCSCLGQCGNGPMVLVLPEEVWYAGVQPRKVAAIVQQHLEAGEPIGVLLYAKVHPHNRGPARQ